MRRMYEVDIHIYNTLKKGKGSKMIGEKTYTILANSKDDAGGKAMDKAWEEKRENPEKFKGCVFGFNLEKIRPVTEVR